MIKEALQNTLKSSSLLFLAKYMQIAVTIENICMPTEKCISSETPVLNEKGLFT